METMNIKTATMLELVRLGFTGVKQVNLLDPEQFDITLEYADVNIGEYESVTFDMVANKLTITSEHGNIAVKYDSITTDYRVEHRTDDWYEYEITHAKFVLHRDGRIVASLYYFNQECVI